MMSDIVCVGGNTGFKGFQNRLQLEFSHVWNLNSQTMQGNESRPNEDFLEFVNVKDQSFANLEGELRFLYLLSSLTKHLNQKHIYF